MEQFNLEEYKKNPNRKIATRDGRVVRIICCDAKNSKPIVALVLTRSISQREFDELTVSYFNDGTYYGKATEDFLDLFFADEEEKPQSIEIPFGAFDSEFVKDEYYIPEGCEARIEGNKVIIEKIQKEELTEFEKELINLVFKYKYWDSSKDKVKQGIKKDSKLLLDLARKEILKDFPKWKKATEYKEFEVHVCVMDEDMCMDEDTYTYLDTTVIEGEYYIELSDLKTLPKEE